jgi:hypothetical protein
MPRALGAVLAAVTLLAGGLAGAGVPPSARAATIAPSVAKPAPRRIWYPGPNYPGLVLPDGTRRQIRSLLDVPHAMSFGDYAWDEDGVPPGPIWVRVDVAAQVISVFRGEHEIGTAVILYGAPAKPTPLGAFHVLQKARDYQSRTYEAPMPYMLRLTDDGVAIHASNVREGWATHGCIGVPMEFAKRLFSQARLGDTVVISGVHGAKSL